MADFAGVLAARLNKGMTQRELAAAAGVPLTTVQRLETGGGASPRNAKRVADFFGCLVTDLLPPLDPREPEEATA
jgi:transcriptional regulator with XRE-family HTH domain